MSFSATKALGFFAAATGSIIASILASSVYDAPPPIMIIFDFGTDVNAGAFSETYYSVVFD
jgi:hypothetical protein